MGECRVIGATVHVRHQSCVGDVGDEIVAGQHYDIDAAANARNGCVPLAPACESAVHYSRKSFGEGCCWRYPNHIPNIIYCSSDREVTVACSRLATTAELLSVFIPALCRMVARFVGIHPVWLKRIWVDLQPVWLNGLGPEWAHRQ